MKNLVSFFCLLSLLLVSGCGQEEVLKNDSTSVPREGRTFTTSFENNDSRTYVENGLYSRWTKGDRISLFDASTLNSQYHFGGETGDSGGAFFMLSKPEGTGTALSANYAVYPYSEDVKMTGDGQISVTLPAIQHYAENSYGLGDNTMVAVTEDTDDTFLNFKNVGGCFKFQLYGDDVTVKSITLKGNNGEKIAGKATITAAYGGTPVVTMADDATDYISLYCGEKGVKIGVSEMDATTFWVVVPPVTFEKGINITVADVNGKVFTQTTDKKLVIERNVVKPMTAVDVVVTDKLYYTYLGVEDGEECEWDNALIMSNGYYSLYKTDSLNHTIIYVDKMATESADSKVIGEFDENNKLLFLHMDTLTYQFYNQRDGIADVMFVKDGNLEIIENVENSFSVNSRAGVSQNNYIKGLSTLISVKNVLNPQSGVAEKTLDAVGLGLSTGEFSPTQGLVLDLSLTTIGVGIAGLGITGVAAFVSSPVVIGAAVVGGVMAFANYLEALQNEDKERMYRITAGNCSTYALAPERLSNNTYKVGMGIYNSESIPTAYKKWNYCGIILQKYIPPTSPSFNAYSKNVEMIMYDRVSTDGQFHVILSNLEAGYHYRYRSFIIPYPETGNFNMPETGSSNANKGSSYFSKIYYSDVQSFTIDNTYINSCEQADQPFCYKSKEIVFSIDVNARFDNPPHDYALSDWGIAVYNNDDMIGKVPIGIGKWNQTVNIKFAASDLDIDKENFTAKTLGKWFVSTYRTYSADGYSGTKFSEERYPVDLTYDQKPSLTISNLSVGSTESINDGNRDRKTTYSYDLDIEGAFWMDEIYSYYVGNWTNPGKQGSYNLWDGSWGFGEAGVKFSSESKPHTSYKYYAAIVNGKEIKSTNSFVYNFNGPSCSISLSGGGATMNSTENAYGAIPVINNAPSYGMSVFDKPEFIYGGEWSKHNTNLIED